MIMSNSWRVVINRWCALALVFSTSVPAQQAIAVSGVRLMYATMPWPCDAVSATLKKDPANLWTFLSSWDRTYKYLGTLENPWRDKVVIKHAYYYDEFSDYAIQHSAEYVYDYGTSRYQGIKDGGGPVSLYLKNVHTIGPKELLGFLHVEYLFQDGSNPYPSYYSIALCHSTNNGDHWTFCGDIIRTNNTHSDGRCNIGGAAYILKDGYYYVYFNEVDTNYNVFPSVARADTAVVNAAARAGRVSEWRKYSGNGAWNEPACSRAPGLGVRIIPESVLPSPDMHADAAYCSCLKEYLLALRSISNLYLLRSSDGIEWHSPQLLAARDSITLRIPSYPYFASLDKDASEDCSIVGREFSVYFLNVLYEPVSGDRLSLYRVRMTVHDKPQ